MTQAADLLKKKYLLGTPEFGPWVKELLGFSPCSPGLRNYLMFAVETADNEDVPGGGIVAIFESPEHFGTQRLFVSYEVQEYELELLRREMAGCLWKIAGTVVGQLLPEADPGQEVDPQKAAMHIAVIFGGSDEEWVSPQDFALVKPDYWDLCLDPLALILQWIESFEQYYKEEGILEFQDVVRVATKLLEYRGDPGDD